MTSDESFAALIKAAQNGEQPAWARIYRDLAGPVRGYLSSRGAGDPDDLTSETFLQVARNIGAFSGSEASFRSWVFVIAHRRLIDARRRSGRKSEGVSLEGQAVDSIGGDVEAEAMDQLATSEVEKVLDSLTEEQRDVLALRVIGNLTLEETAHVLGKTLGSVKALQRRGLATLRSAIGTE